MPPAKSDMTSPATAVFLDTSVPNVARIFDYLAGGTANFEVDRRAAAAMSNVIPSIQKWVRLRRAFIQEAARQLYEGGFRQFLDFGSGMPADDHIHAFTPEAHIVFSDINPVAVSYGQSFFADKPHVAYIRGDVREIHNIFLADEVRRLLNLKQPVAIGLNGLPLFMSERENQQLAQALYDWAPAGSQIFVVFQTRGDKEVIEAYEQFKKLSRAAGLPIELYTHQQYLNMLRPWQPEIITPIVEFLGLPADFITSEDETEIELAFYAAFLKK